MSLTLFIIVITCLVSVLGFNNPDIVRKLAHYPVAEKNNKEYYRMLTAGFVHGDMFHLFVNMFVLYGFGEFVEAKFKELHGEMAGSIIYVLFYLLIVVLANIPSYVKNQNNARYSAIGASGATSGVLFSYILFSPLSWLELYFFLPIPAIVFGVIYLWYSNYASRKLNDMIDHDAHFYGAIAGFLFTALMKKELIFDFINELTSILQ